MFKRNKLKERVEMIEKKLVAIETMIEAQNYRLNSLYQGIRAGMFALKSAELKRLDIELREEIFKAKTELGKEMIEIMDLRDSARRANERLDIAYKERDDLEDKLREKEKLYRGKREEIVTGGG